ncbi:MAG TPA: hypothetical protein VM692_12990, partial [Gammaproteobacteria bacterium]|nr:hypothetical protein [Gammaproteobacteria bacterium]
PYSAQQQRAFAVALLLGTASSGGIKLELGPGDVEEPAPLAPLFMAWALSNETTFRRTAGGQGWTWRRLGA